MRELEVLRVESDGEHVICIDRENDEHFRMRAADLRTALPPETTEDEPPAVETPVPAPSPEAVLRPRDIQARIRAGATVEELAAISGVGVSKIERYAHPVLLERARAAELARASHPMGMDGPSLSSLGELVAECLALRGGIPSEARWDAWKADGYWMVQVAWYESGTEGYAHWRFHPGAHGGTTEPIDELAAELTDPELARKFRRRPVLAPVRPEPEPTPPPQRRMTSDGHEQVTVDADGLVEAQASGSKPVRTAPPLADVLDLRYSSGDALEASPAPAEPLPPFADEDAAAALPIEDEPYFEDPDAPAAGAPAGESADAETFAEREARPAAEDKPEPATSTPRHRTKKLGKPAVPAWEDVLLGVRSHPDN